MSYRSLVFVFGLLSALQASRGDILCNICNTAHGCCTGVIVSGGVKTSCMIDNDYGMELSLDDGRGGMSLKFTRQGGTCFQVPAIGSISTSAGGDASNEFYIHTNGVWGDWFVLYELTSGGYSVCWNEHCCIVKGSSGSCGVPDRTLTITNVDQGTSSCSYGMLQMYRSDGYYAHACLDRRPNVYQSDFFLYWDESNCSGVNNDRVSAVCKPWGEGSEGRNRTLRHRATSEE